MPIQHFTKQEIEAWPPEHKGCKTCREVKPLSSFHRLRNGLLGRATKCKDCRHLDSKRQYAEKTLEEKMVSRAKGRAKRKGVPFNLTPNDIDIPTHCPILGFELEESDGVPATHNSPSLDRIVPELGYVAGNVVVISYKANMIKSNATADEIRAVADWLDTI